MACLMVEGFDKYGAANVNATAVNALLTAGEWTTSAGSNTAIVAPLSSNGFGLLISGNQNIAKTLAASYSRLIGGFRFSSTLGANSGITLQDTTTAQASVTINTTGTVSVRNGAFAGTALGTSASSITANTSHYLEFDITFGNSANYQVWMDGVSILSGTGDTTGSANNNANVILLGGPTGTNITFDDFYLFDTAGSVNNAALLTSPRVETQFPVADSSVQFAVGAAILGSSASRSSTPVNTAANQFRVRPFTPTRNMTVIAVVFLPNASNASINLRPVAYSDSASVPGTLLSAGSTVVGMTAGAAVTMPLTTPQALMAGTQYWLGFMCDISVTSGLTGLDGTNTDRTATSTFASGAPGTAPATSASLAALTWGSVTLASPVNWYEVSQTPPQGAYSNLTDSTTGHEDLYTFGSLSPVSTVHAVAMKANCARSDSGARTVSMRMLSGGTDGGGASTGQTPATSFGWLTSLFATDPATGAAWSPTAVNAATAGFKIDS